MAESHHQPQMGKPSLLKRAARKGARIVYRMVLPILRPIAFRTRRYLTQGLQDELSRSLVELDSFKVAIHGVRNEVREARAELLHEIRHTHALGLEVLQKTAASVQHEVLINASHWHITERQEAQVSFSDLHQAIQFARESVREDVLRTALTTTTDLSGAFADKASKQQSEAHSHQLEAHALQLKVQAHTLEAYAQQWEARAHQLEAHALQSEARVHQLEADAEESEARARQLEAYAQESEARARQLDAYEQQSAGHAQLLEGYAHQLEAYAASTFTRLDRIEHLGNIAARRTAIHGENGVVLVKTEVGYVLCSDSDHAVLACLLETGELEFGTRVLIERFLKPGDVFVDVGAHLGLMSLAAARALRGEGRIFAFEPFPQTRNLLERSFWINGLTHMIQIGAPAVSNVSGETTLFLGANSGHHSIFSLDLPVGYSTKQITVPTVTLDEALPPGQKVALIKIDAEGAELHVIQGARALEANNPDMAYIVEFGPSHLKRAGHSTEQWLAAFADLGLTYKAIGLETGALEDISVDQLAAAESVNLFFARPGSSAWARLD
jgi:FkbM family methyltransferase